MTAAASPSRALRVNGICGIRCGSQPGRSTALVGSPGIVNPDCRWFPGADVIDQGVDFNRGQTIAKGWHAGIRSLTASDDAVFNLLVAVVSQYL